jgi:hypothetical protein
MDTKIEGVLASINETVHAAFETQMQSFETKMVNKVKETLAADTGKLVANVAASVTGENLPYVTSAALQLTLDTFLTKIEANKFIARHLFWQNTWGTRYFYNLRVRINFWPCATSSE